MKALDTNVLVRFLVRDDERQALAVYRMFTLAEQNRDSILISTPVLLETIWVLESAYDIGRGEILDALDDLMLMPILEFESQPAVRRFIREARDSKFDLPDLLIACSAHAAGCETVVTFDRRAARSHLFEMLR